MRRLALTMFAVILALGSTVPAYSVPGPDPSDGSSYFEISVREDLNHENPPPPPRDEYSLTRFDESLGWDFGDRIGYECAWVEFFSAGNEKFEVHYELVADYPFDLRITDRFGAESQVDGRDPFNLCGSGTFGTNGNAVHDGSDHFPHGTALTFYVNSQQIASIDYSLTQLVGCDKGYWTPGDEAGEAWLWWDEDGPQQHMPNGPIVCDGGPMEPVAVMRAIVKNADADVGYCTQDELSGDDCSSSLPGHASRLTLRLSGHVKATGDVRVPDGTVECLRSRSVVIQRKESGAWRRIGHDRTDATGHYALHVRPKQGRYRAKVLTNSLGTGDLCMQAISRRVLL